MKRAFTLIELMLVILIIVTLAVGIAVPHIIDSRNKAKRFEAGKTAIVTASGIKITLLRRQDYNFWICRIDNGEGAVPRYSEVTFNINELHAELPKVER